MIRLSVGAVSSRSLRRPTKRLVQRIVLFTSQDEVLANAEGHGPMTLRVAAPALHAGEYHVDPAALANGPVCLVLPEVSLTPEGAVAKPGLWACNPQLGPADLTGQWAFEAASGLAILGLTLTLAADLAGRVTHYKETARQAGSTVVATSAPLTLPEMPVQEPDPQPDLPPQDPEPEQPSPVDPLPPAGDPAPEAPKLKVVHVDNGTFQFTADPTKPLIFTIDQPHPHAGTHLLTQDMMAALGSGPVCLALPEVSLTPEEAIAKPGLWACDPELGPVEVTGQWAFEADPDLGRPGLTLALAADLAGRTTHYSETARQAGSTVVATSAPLTLPEMPVQEPDPQPDLPPQDPEPEQPSPPAPPPADPLPPVDNPAPEEPKFKVIYVDDGTFQLSADPAKPISLTIDPPHPHAGTYLITPGMMAEMAFGPVCLVLPVISIDEKLTSYSLVKAGLWVFDSGRGSISVTRHWQQGNALLAATGGQTLAFEDRYRGVPVAMVERAVQAGAERIAASAAITVPLNYRPADVFADVAVHNTPLQNYVGLSGEGWAKTFEHSSNTVLNKNTGRLEGGNSSGPSYVRGAADRGSKQFAEARVSHGSNANGSGYGIQVRAQGNNGYILAHTTAGTAFPNGALRLRRITNGTFSTIATIEGPFPQFAAKGDTATIRLEAEGNQLRLALNGVWHGPYTDGTFTGGGVGVRTNGSGPGVLNSNTEIMSFSGGSL